MIYKIAEDLLPIKGSRQMPTSNDTNVFWVAQNVSMCLFSSIKDPFRDPQPHPPIFLQKVEIFIPVEAFRYVLFVLKIFLANLLVWRSNRRFCVFFMSTWKFQHIVAYATVWYSKNVHNSKTQPQNWLKIWK